MPSGSLGLELLAQQLRLEAEIRDKADRAVTASAQNIKQQWNARMKSRRSTPTHIPYLPEAIGYDQYRGTEHFTATIGVNKRHYKRQGPLAHLLEFGSVNNAPHNDGGRALRAEEDVFHARFVKIAEEFL